MTASELLTGFRALPREERIEFLSEALQAMESEDSPTAEAFLEKIRRMDFQAQPRSYSEAELAELRRRAQNTHLATPLEDFIGELSEADFQN